MASLLAPFLGLLCGLLAFYVLCEGFSWYWARGLDAGILTLVGFAILGLFCGLAALARRERLWGVTAVGLLLNGGLLSFYLVAMR